MKIGITGAHSTGKTTLLNALRGEASLAGYDYCVEVTRWVKRLGFSINENSSDEVQELVMIKHVYNMFMHDNSVSDRTVLDGLVYSTWLNRNGKVSNKTLDMVNKVYDRMEKEYDIIFYIRPEFEVEDDGVRSIDKRFHQEIVDLFEEVIKRKQIPVVQLTGSVRERVEQVLKEVECQTK